LTVNLGNGIRYVAYGSRKKSSTKNQPYVPSGPGLGLKGWFVFIVIGFFGWIIASVFAEYFFGRDWMLSVSTLTIGVLMTMFYRWIKKVKREEMLEHPGDTK